MKEIKKEEIELLKEHNEIYNTNRGLVDKRRKPIGFYRTRNKRYVEDKYVDIAMKLG